MKGRRNEKWCERTDQGAWKRRVQASQRCWRRRPGEDGGHCISWDAYDTTRRANSPRTTRAGPLLPRYGPSSPGVTDSLCSPPPIGTARAAVVPSRLQKEGLEREPRIYERGCLPRVLSPPWLSAFLDSAPRGACRGMAALPRCGLNTGLFPKH